MDCRSDRRCCGLRWLAASRRVTAGRNDPRSPLRPSKSAFMRSEVQPILKARCLKCHGGGPKVKANFRVDSREGLLRGGDLGPAVSLEAPGESRLLQAIRYEELEMPPAGKLPAREIEVLTRWVNDGDTVECHRCHDGRYFEAKGPALRRPRSINPPPNTWSLRPGCPARRYRV